MVSPVLASMTVPESVNLLDWACKDNGPGNKITKMNKKMFLKFMILWISG